MNTQSVLSQAVKGALALGAAGGMVSAGTALAQQAPAPSTTTNLSRIVVTGSHIPQTAIATAQPVVTINRQEIQNSGFTTIGNLLQHMSAVGASLGVNFNNGGNGSATINLHNLGAQRVLVLVNGQRWITGLSGTADLTTIPSGVVQRIEILMDGASAIYGSEAIAGVINIITVKNFNGARASAYLGMYDATNDGGSWDGRTKRYHFLVGSSSDRSSVLLGAGYYHQKAVWAGDRTQSQEPVLGAGNTAGSSNTPTGRYFFGALGGQPLPTPPGSTTPYAGCSSTGFIQGLPGCNLAGPFDGSSAHPFTNADRYNYAPENYLRTPSERWYIYSQGHYNLTNSISFHFVTTYQRRNSSQVLAPNPWALGAAGYTTSTGYHIGVAKNNPYNPFNADLVPVLGNPAKTAAWCAKFGSSSCTSNHYNLLLLGWRPLNAPHRDFHRIRQTYYLNGGFSGFWRMFNNQWTWNADYIYSSQNTELITTGLASTNAIAKHLSSACTSTDPDTGCLALDMFHGAHAQTPAQMKPLLFIAHAVNRVHMRDYNANIGGGFFSGWYAGSWGVAAGYEYLEQDGSFSPDAFVSKGYSVGNAASPTHGRQVTNAQYIEMSIPLASDVFMAQSLVLDLANRWSQFEWGGIGADFNPATGAITTGAVNGSASASTSRATLKWKPVDELLIRASWAENFRIPSISELFGGVGDSYPQVTDPCATNASASYPGCGFQHTQINSQIVSTVGGSPSLTPESAITRSIGVVYSPSWLDGLDVSVDYYNVQVQNLITSKGAQYYLDKCYKSGNPGNACQHIKLVGNVIQRIYDLNINGGSYQVAGVDVGVNYRFPTTAIGQFNVGMHGSWTRKVISCDVTGTCMDISGSVTSGFSGIPKHKINFSLDWTYGPWAATWNTYLIGGMWEGCDSSNFTAGPLNFSDTCSNPEKYVDGDQVGQNHLGTTVYHDVNVSYTLSSWNTTFTLGVLNIFDKKPPIARTAFANSMLPMYRIPGRYWYGRVSVRF